MTALKTVHLDLPARTDDLRKLLDAVPSYFSQGVVSPDRSTANLAFGGPDLRTLFFTARTSVYTLRAKVPGQSHPWYRLRAR